MIQCFHATRIGALVLALSLWVLSGCVDQSVPSGEQPTPATTAVATPSLSAPPDSTATTEVGEIATTETLESPVAASPESTVPGAGDPLAPSFQVGDLTITINQVGDTPVNALIEPEAEQRFVLIDLTVTNNGTVETAVSSLLQMVLRDTSGQEYAIDSTAALAAGVTSPDGQLAPGAQRQGKVGFQVPQNVTDLELVLRDVFGNEGSLPLPAPAADAPALYAIGEPVQVGTLVITLNQVLAPQHNIFQPDAGERFVALDLTVGNISDAEQMVSSLLQLRLQDTAGQTYSPDLDASFAAGDGTMQTPDGIIQPGEERQGQVGFALPADAEGLVLRLEDLEQGRAYILLP
ncbi:MAG: DUF4352 domain-containing protein [Chloroflexaceae bacterium]|nr:DUF4352 domain-containing protein [Chloroflexaceae bacterium]